MTDDGEWMIDDDGDDDVPAPPHAILLCFGVCRCFRRSHWIRREELCICVNVSGTFASQITYRW